MVGASVPGSGRSLASLPRAAPNKALEPTASSFGFATLRLRFRRRLTASVRPPKLRQNKGIRVVCFLLADLLTSLT